MRDLLDRSKGNRLDLNSYTADFDGRFWDIGGEGFWKLECLQNYQETGFPSWEAFLTGDWAGALRLIEELRPDFEQYYNQAAAAGFGLHRVRVLERPVSAYAQWELEVLRVRSQCGEDSVVLVDGDRTQQAGQPLTDLPDVVVLGTEAAYQVHYTEDGLPDGATLFTEPEVVEGARAFIQRLYRSGERLEAFYAREIADLGAPEL
jgi:hypothetical protein